MKCKRCGIEHEKLVTWMLGSEKVHLCPSCAERLKLELEFNMKWKKGKSIGKS